jgi:hypothetical protein
MPCYPLHPIKARSPSRCTMGIHPVESQRCHYLTAANSNRRCRNSKKAFDCRQALRQDSCACVGLARRLAIPITRLLVRSLRALLLTMKNTACLALSFGIHCFRNPGHEGKPRWLDAQKFNHKAAAVLYSITQSQASVRSQRVFKEPARRFRVARSKTGRSLMQCAFT